MPMSDFSKGERGDKIWDAIKDEWGEILEVLDPKVFEPVVALFPNSRLERFHMDGREHKDDLIPRYFWDVLQIPVRKKRRKRKVWVNFHRVVGDKGIWVTCHDGLREAKKYVSSTDMSRENHIATHMVELKVEHE